VKQCPGFNPVRHCVVQTLWKCSIDLVQFSLVYPGRPAYTE
jgi:hypothetical protein